MPKKVTHCADFYGILETVSNLMRKYKKSEKLYNADQGTKSHTVVYAVQMRFCNTNESKLNILCQKGDSFVMPGFI